MVDANGSTGPTASALPSAPPFETEANGYRHASRHLLVDVARVEAGSFEANIEPELSTRTLRRLLGGTDELRARRSRFSVVRNRVASHASVCARETKAQLSPHSVLRLPIRSTRSTPRGTRQRPWRGDRDDRYSERCERVHRAERGHDGDPATHQLELGLCAAAPRFRRRDPPSWPGRPADVVALVSTSTSNSSPTVGSRPMGDGSGRWFWMR
jgi:hypothetical protein